jgi:ribosomal peptide maturation radical SAM protein 1
MPRVLLVNMPFGSLRWPQLGLGLLKAALAARDIACDVAYFNFELAERVGLEHYQWLADDFAFVLGGERLFAKQYFAKYGKWLPSDEDYYRNVLLAADPGLTEGDHAAFLDTARHVEPFLDACMDAVDWSRYAVVGFSASFQQTMPSLCLARRIKQLRPEIRIVFGGAACEGCMGPELKRQFSEIDCVFSGEADRSFPQAIKKWIHEAHGDREEREPRETCVGWEAGTVENLDELPYPDFDDYFSRLERSPLRGELDPFLFFETSRGCWWGRKCRCAFCGLNGDRLGYRKKSPQRALDELRHLVERYGIHRACAADNILDPGYLQSLLPMVQASGLDLSFVYEMKANLTREQVAVLQDAGLAAAQVGIESLSTPVLKQIGKGVTAMQNLQTLRWFSEAGIAVQWNLLYGFPGEDPTEYAKMADLLPSLFHLCPPQIAGRVRVDRFSPYYEDPARHGIVNVRPGRAFGYVFPFSEEVLARLAYHFDYDYADGRDVLGYASPVIEVVGRWRQLAGSVTLRYWDRPDGVLILTDTRPTSDDVATPGFQQRRMTGIERIVYLFCDTARTLREIMEHLAQTSDVPPPDETTIARMLETLVNERLMAHLDGRYLSLALRSA